VVVVDPAATHLEPLDLVVPEAVAEALGGRQRPTPEAVVAVRSTLQPAGTVVRVLSFFAMHLT
jgi:hypothetical protein